MSESKELLVNTIKEWVAINNKINEIQKLLKDLRGKKKQLSDSLIKIMENNEIDGIDINNGKLAFVFNLTKNWKPQYGGILHFLNTNRTDILHSFVPSFNNLLIFEVPKEGIPHYVSHIAPLVKYNRYALTGWYE